MNILVVGMLNSIHLVRWVKQFKNFNNIKLYIYPLEPVIPHKDLRKNFLNLVCENCCYFTENIQFNYIVV